MADATKVGKTNNKKSAKAKKGPSFKRASGRKKRSSLTAAQREMLLALEDSYEDAIDHPVVETLQEARELEAAERKLGKELYKKSSLTKVAGRSLHERRELLGTAEAEWTDVRARTLTSNVRDAREEAEKLKRDAIAALRHFRRKDEGVQRRLDAIVPGTGVADLVDDLGKLAELMDEHAVALQKAELPRNAAKRARVLADVLGEGSADRAVDPDGAQAMALRNRAFWWLREAMDEIRSAGRYVYRNDPKLLALFRASGTRARARRRKPVTKAPEAPTEPPANKAPGKPDPTEE
jgi:hypothetical protein